MNQVGELRLSDIRKVTLSFVRGGGESYLVPLSEISRFVDASIRLHWKPGRNPATGGETARIWKITVAGLEARGPYWWSTPSLMENDDPAGARIIDGGLEKTVFVDQEVVDRWNDEEAEMEAAEEASRRRVRRRS